MTQHAPCDQLITTLAVSLLLRLRSAYFVITTLIVSWREWWNGRNRTISRCESECMMGGTDVGAQSE